MKKKQRKAIGHENRPNKENITRDNKLEIKTKDSIKQEKRGGGEIIKYEENNKLISSDIKWRKRRKISNEKGEEKGEREMSKGAVRDETCRYF